MYADFLLVINLSFASRLVYLAATPWSSVRVGERRQVDDAIFSLAHTRLSPSRRAWALRSRRPIGEGAQNEAEQAKESKSRTHDSSKGVGLVAALILPI